MTTRAVHSLRSWPRRPEFDAMPAALKAGARWIEVASGELLFRCGETPERIYFVQHGEVRLRRLSADGAEIVLQRARHSFLAEASIESSAYHCDAVASEPALALAFPMPLFRAGLQACAVFRDAWMAHLMGEVRRSRAQCERLALRAARARILHYLESEGTDGCLQLAGTRKAWASELGLTHEALYRALADLQREGVIRAEGDTIRRC